MSTTENQPLPPAPEPDGSAGEVGQETRRNHATTGFELISCDSVPDRHAARLAPVVAALQAKGAKIAAAELARLGGKLGGIDHQAHTEIAQAIYRVADQLLHVPTARASELNRSAGGDFCETALRVLFDLDPTPIDMTTSADARS